MPLLEIIARAGDSFVVVVVSKETGFKNISGEGKGDRIGESNSSGLKFCCVCLNVGGSIVVSSLS